MMAATEWTRGIAINRAPLFLAALLAMSATPEVLAQSAVSDAVSTLKTFGNIDGIDGRWIWANMSAFIDLNAPSGEALASKMAQFCPEDRAPVMAIETAEGGFDIGVIDAPPGLRWQYRRDRTGAYTQSVDASVFYPALGYSDQEPPSKNVVEANERNSGSVMVIRPDEDVLLITHRNGYDMFVRCDER